MKKYDILGTEMVKLRDVCHAIRKLRKKADTVLVAYTDAQREAMKEAYNNVVRQIYFEEIHAAESQDEVDAILEMTGDFIVYKRGNDKYDITYFKGFGENGAVFTRKPHECMYFDYESKAEEIAEYLGEGWTVLDASPEAESDAQRLLNVIFGTSEVEE